MNRLGEDVSSDLILNKYAICDAIGYLDYNKLESFADSSLSLLHRILEDSMEGMADVMEGITDE